MGDAAWHGPLIGSPRLPPQVTRKRPHWRRDAATGEDGERPAGRLRMVTPDYFVLRFDRHTVHTHQAPFPPSGGDELLKRLKICHYH